ncbi:MAG: TusE/DsrC/DsvC family sulfur relay protein [Thermoplasmata archaeon]
MTEEEYINIITKSGEKKKVSVDEDGFLINPDDWSEDFAEAICKDEGIEKLTEEHWKVIHYLRNYFITYNTCPPIRMVVKDTGFQLKKIYELFPTGPAKGACRMAGAPKPTGCV